MNERPNAGHFTVGNLHWRYAEDDGKFDLWCLNDEVTVPSVAAASRHLRTLHPVRPSAIRVRTVPAPYEALDEPLTWNDLRPEYDRMLKAALRLLGVDANNYDTGGMPSEYRGWLNYARIKAQHYYWTDGEANDPLTKIAYEVVTGACAVSLSMRNGHVTLPFTMAVALAGLRKHIPK